MPAGNVIWFASGLYCALTVCGRIPHSVLIEIFTEAGIGTKITA